MLYEVITNFYRLYFLDQIITVTRQSNDTLQNLLQAADTQYAVGKIRQKDVLSLQEQRYQLQARLLVV